MRKSSFSPSIYRMWLRRYWVGSALIAIAFLLAAIIYSTQLQMIKLYAMPDTPTALYLLVPTTSIMQAVFVSVAAVVAGMLCFNYMQNSRAAVMTHALPMQRKSLFFSVNAAGITLLVAPLVLASIMFGLVQLSSGEFTIGMLLMWLLTMVSVAVLFFGATCFMGMLTGNSIAQGILTLLFINLPIILETMYIGYCNLYLFGFTVDEPVSAWVNPYYLLARQLSDIGASEKITNGLAFWLPFIFLGVGALLYVGALALYKKRRIEAAGDTIAVKAVRPVFRFGLALLGAGLSTLIFVGMLNITSFGVQLIVGILGGVIGCFAAEMFLRRTVRVFKHYKSALAFAAAFTLVMCLLNFDVFGYGTMQLKPEDVTAICFSYESPRVDAALEQSEYLRIGQYSDIFIDDLNLEDEGGYLEKLRAGEKVGKMPEGIARQILEQDKTVFSGARVQQGVDFQNLIARNAAELKKTDAGNSGYDDEQYYYVNMRAKLKNGKVVKRQYSFRLKNGQLPKVQAAWNGVTETVRRGEVETVVDVSAHADYLRIYSYNFMPHDLSVVLNKGDWDGLFEAVIKDLETPGDDLYANMLDITLGMEDKTNAHYSILVSAKDENTVKWMIDREIITRQQVDEFIRSCDGLDVEYDMEYVQ